jgi:3',5'-cyclic-AMP phosphodiesterase
MQILQITDPHLYGNASGNLRGVETDSSLRNVLDDALSPAVDYAAILVTGDLVQDDPTGYLRFKSIMGHSRKPVLCIPGNHDEPDAMRRSLSEAPFQYCGTHVIGPWQFIMLDSYDPGHVGGRLTAAELARLDAALAKSPAHALVCLHHHPVAMGSRWLDGIGLANADAFWRVIDAHRQVRGIVWGHVHQVYDGERKGVRLFATPSTGAQFLPMSERYAVDTRPPAYRRFELHADGRIDSEVHWIEPQVSRQATAR